MPRRSHRPRFAGSREEESPAQDTNLCALSDLVGGTRATVRNLQGGSRFLSRLGSMGFTEGTGVEVIQNLGQGAILIAVRGTQVALGHREASRILVQMEIPQGTPSTPAPPIKVALTGQPNAGKTTVFNSLTGLAQHVGNWPGKTVEHASGLVRHRNTMMHIVDLPGTYSLTANSPEERIARNHILTEHPDVVVDIVDASSLERNLYLLSELLALPAPVVVGLNMMDVAEQRGIRVEAHVLEAALGLPVVPMVASRDLGVQELLQAVEDVACHRTVYAPRRPEIRQDHAGVLAILRLIIADHTPAPYPPDWVALKLLEGDEQITSLVRKNLDEADWTRVHQILKEHEDAILAIAGGRYEWIERMVRAAVTRPHAGQITVTERVDRIAVHPVWGLLMLFAILGVVFWSTFALGIPLQQWINGSLVHPLAVALNSILSSAPWWLSALLTDGVLAGAGMVLSFLPIIVIFFVVLGLFEEVGYMARAAYVTDRFMHWMGLHGKSSLPLCIGCGCNVPGVLCARIIESPRARLLTILLTPLVPCSARLTVLAMLAPLFFGTNAVWVALGVIGFNLVLLMAVGYALHELVLGGEHVAFIMEMPLYHAPDLRMVGLSVGRRSVEFLVKAGGVIVVVSVLVWVCSTLPDGDLQTSYLATFGEYLAPIGAWMGLDWRMIVALLTSVAAKENTIATLAILYQESGLNTLAATTTPATALAFLVIQVTFIPCIPTVAAIRQETRSWRWTIFSVVLLLGISCVAGIVVYQVGRLL